jgi:cytochrome c oxidase assembly factor CtaG
MVTQAPRHTCLILFCMAAVAVIFVVQSHYYATPSQPQGQWSVVMVQLFFIYMLIRILLNLGNSCFHLFSEFKCLILFQGS